MSDGVPFGFSELARGQSWSKLQQAIKQKAWKLPPERKHRTTAEMERWIVNAAIQSKNSNQLFGSPLPPFVLAQKDKPDIWLECGNGSVGIDISEVTDPLTAKARSIAQELGLEVFTLPKTKDIGASSSSMEIRRFFEQARDGSPWVGDEPVQELVRLVRQLIGTKVKKAEGYIKADKMYLLLYENTGLPLNANASNSIDVPITLDLLACSVRADFDGILLLTEGRQLRVL